MSRLARQAGIGWRVSLERYGGRNGDNVVSYKAFVALAALAALTGCGVGARTRGVMALKSHGKAQTATRQTTLGGVARPQ